MKISQDASFGWGPAGLQQMLLEIEGQATFFGQIAANFL
jgi:hypothetical protein